MITAESVKARLKHNARLHGRNILDELVLYGLERTIYRISVSEYADRFTLKGGIFLYALFNRDYARATTDIDLLARRIPNGTEQMETIFRNIFAIECDDALRFDLASLKVSTITEFKQYPGVNLSINAFLDRTRIHISIDIGFDDVLYPDRVRMQFPVLLDMPAPEVYAYSVYSVVAEKFEALTSLGLTNGRYKDFYDIYILASSFDFSGAELKTSVSETFSHRGTGFDDIAAFDPSFTADPVRRTRWSAFVKKKHAMENVSFDETMQLLRTFLQPIADAITAGSPFDRTWSAADRRWKD